MYISIISENFKNQQNKFTLTAQAELTNNNHIAETPNKKGLQIIDYSDDDVQKFIDLINQGREEVTTSSLLRQNFITYSKITDRALEDCSENKQYLSNLGQDNSQYLKENLREPFKTVISLQHELAPLKNFKNRFVHFFDDICTKSNSDPQTAKQYFEKYIEDKRSIYATRYNKWQGTYCGLKANSHAVQGATRVVYWKKTETGAKYSRKTTYTDKNTKEKVTCYKGDPKFTWAGYVSEAVTAPYEVATFFAGLYLRTTHSSAKLHKSSVSNLVLDVDAEFEDEVEATLYISDFITFVKKATGLDFILPTYIIFNTESKHVQYQWLLENSIPAGKYFQGQFLAAVKGLSLLFWEFGIWNNHFDRVGDFNYTGVLARNPFHFSHKTIYTGNYITGGIVYVEDEDSGRKIKQWAGQLEQIVTFFRSFWENANNSCATWETALSYDFQKYQNFQRVKASTSQKYLNPIINDSNREYLVSEAVRNLERVKELKHQKKLISEFNSLLDQYNIYNRCFNIPKVHELAEILGFTIQIIKNILLTAKHSIDINLLKLYCKHQNFLYKENQNTDQTIKDPIAFLTDQPVLIEKQEAQNTINVTESQNNLKNNAVKRKQRKLSDLGITSRHVLCNKRLASEGLKWRLYNNWKQLPLEKAEELFQKVNISVASELGKVPLGEVEMRKLGLNTLSFINRQSYNSKYNLSEREYNINSSKCGNKNSSFTRSYYPRAALLKAAKEAKILHNCKSIDSQSLILRNRFVDDLQKVIPGITADVTKYLKMFVLPENPKQYDYNRIYKLFYDLKRSKDNLLIKAKEKKQEIATARERAIYENKDLDVEEFFKASTLELEKTCKAILEFFLILIVTAKVIEAIKLAYKLQYFKSVAHSITFNDTT